jgi:hypothetical protein
MYVQTARTLTTHRRTTGGCHLQVMACALTPQDMATSIRGGGIVTDGPFADSKEVVAGF